MMKAKVRNGAFSISLLAVALFLLIFNKASGSGLLSLPSDKNRMEGQQRCGFSCDTKCPPGSCCNWFGYCGTTQEYCGRQHCQSQCPTPPPPPYEPRQCGIYAEGIKCPPGMCCSTLGWCGTTDDYCAPEWCESQCWNTTTLTSDDKNLEGPRDCGYQGCYKKCPTGSCCSNWGWCGTTKEYCGKRSCQSQCPPPPPPPPPPPYAPGRCGRQAGGRKCPPGLCCSSSGWCGATKFYCAKEWCQSQCKSTTLTSSVMNM